MLPKIIFGVTHFYFVLGEILESLCVQELLRQPVSSSSGLSRDLESLLTLPYQRDKSIKPCSILDRLDTICY